MTETVSLAGPLPVADLLNDAVRDCLEAAADLAKVRTGQRPSVAVDPAAVAVASSSERWVLLDGAGLGPAFDPLSRFLSAEDGWVRLHGNYSWHRDAATRALKVAHVDDVPGAVARLPAAEVEDAVVAAGGCAVRARTARGWRDHPQGRAQAGVPVVAVEPGPAAPELSASHARPLDSTGEAPVAAPLPAAGLRIVDLTRVIAGPVCTRMLAALGASVTRVGKPDRPEQPLLALDGGLGKRWVDLDLAGRRGRSELERLLAAADAVVLGHRPGALAGYGLAPTDLATRHRQLVCLTLSAWGTGGPWGSRRGFDSLVQVATGIAETVRPSTAEQPPGCAAGAGAGPRDRVPRRRGDPGRAGRPAPGCWRGAGRRRPRPDRDGVAGSGGRDIAGRRVGGAGFCRVDGFCRSGRLGAGGRCPVPGRAESPARPAPGRGTAGHARRRPAALATGVMAELPTQQTPELRALLREEPRGLRGHPPHVMAGVSTTAYDFGLRRIGYAASSYRERRSRAGWSGSSWRTSSSGSGRATPRAAQMAAKISEKAAPLARSRTGAPARSQPRRQSLGGCVVGEAGWRAGNDPGLGATTQCEVCQPHGRPGWPSLSGTESGVRIGDVDHARGTSSQPPISGDQGCA